MHYFNRFLWLLAWGVWIWLGFGLYRELPRQPGAVICTLPVEGPAHTVLGFIGQSNEVGLLIASPDRLKTRIIVHDAETGRIIRQAEGPAFGNYVWLPKTRNDAHILLANDIPNPPSDKPRAGLHRLDLMSCEWSELSNQAASTASVQSGGDYILFVERTTGNRERKRAFVYSQFDRRICFDYTVPNGWSFCGDPTFVEGESKVLITLSRAYDVSAAAPPEINLFSVHNSADPTTIRMAEFPKVSAATPVGRAVLGDRELKSSLAVLGVPGMDVIESLESPLQSNPVATVNQGMAFTATGKLWDLSRETLVWQRRSHERVIPERYESQFRVVERWHQIWESRIPALKFESLAFRDVRDGSLAYRTTWMTAPHPKNWNASETLAVAEDGVVYLMPFCVNWPLFGLCQSILASPIVLLWAASRRRRKQKATRVMTASALQ